MLTRTAEHLPRVFTVTFPPACAYNYHISMAHSEHSHALAFPQGLHVATFAATARANIGNLCLSSYRWASRAEAGAPDHPFPSAYQSSIVVNQ